MNIILAKVVLVANDWFMKRKCGCLYERKQSKHYQESRQLHTGVVYARVEGMSGWSTLTEGKQSKDYQDHHGTYLLLAFFVFLAGLILFFDPYAYIMFPNSLRWWRRAAAGFLAGRC
jgi:hypothetical protein